MGLGADTINYFHESYRREQESVRLRDVNRLKFLASELERGLPRAALHPIALATSQIDVFEAVAAGDIKSEEGAGILMLRREAEHASRSWLERAGLWLVTVLTGGEGGP